MRRVAIYAQGTDGLGLGLARRVSLREDACSLALTFWSEPTVAPRDGARRKTGFTCRKVVSKRHTMTPPFPEPAVKI